jgi:hypothetical protein
MRIASALACVLLPGLLLAAPAAPDKDPAPASPVEKLRADLDRPVTLKIDRQPLSAAVEALHKVTGIAIVVDSMTIQQQMGFTPEQPPVPVAVDAKDMKARNVLRAIVQPYGLSYAVVGDTVVVTTEDVAMYRQMHQRISVDMSNVDLAAALKQIGRDTATNLILDARAEKEAKAEVSLRVEDVPLETAVRLLSEMAGLKPVRVGNTLFVTRKEIAAELRNDPDFATQGQPQPIGVTYAVPAAAGQVFINNAVAIPGGAATVPVPVQPAPAPPALPAVPPAVGPGTGTGSAPPPAPEVKKTADEDTPAKGADAPPEKKGDK